MVIGRNTFDLSHQKALTCDMGELVPIMNLEVIPGDSFINESELLVRFSPMISPVMHEFNVYTHFFFVPCRLLMDDWNDFITGGELGTDATVWPNIVEAGGGYVEGSLGDYLGLPTGVNITHSALPFRAYSLIWNEWYRDQNLQTALTIDKGNGADATTNKVLQKRCWERDYFTSALPFTQRGTEVSMPLGTEAPIEYVTGNTPWLVKDADTDSVHNSEDTLETHLGGGGALEDHTGDDHLKLDPQHMLIADLSAATASTIRDFREALQLQRFLERNARAGSRYTEVILEHFGVSSSDARLDRPEYLGGGKSPMVISEVLSGAEVGADPLGTMGGHGLSLQNTHGFQKSFEEHGFIIGILSIMPRTQYQQGLDRMWSRTDRYDYYWPDFALIGDQAVLNKEIYAAHSSPDDVFGYVPRYEELRRQENKVHGEFRSTLEYWTFARKWSADFVLDDAFVECDMTAASAKYNFANTSDDVCWVQVVHHLKAIRPIPLVGEPSIGSYH